MCFASTQDHTSESLVTSSQHDSTNFLVLLVVLESLVQFNEKLTRQSIQGFGSVESDCGSRLGSEQGSMEESFSERTY